MRERFVFDYAIVRVVPRVDRGEFLNALISFLTLTGYASSSLSTAIRTICSSSPRMLTRPTIASWTN